MAKAYARTWDTLKVEENPESIGKVTAPDKKMMGLTC